MSIGVEEKECIEYLIPYLSENPVVFDVGANKGEWSDLIMNKIPDCEVHLFEANIVLTHYEMMKYDYHKNKIFFVNKAVCSQHNSNIPFYFFTNWNNGLSSLYRNDGYGDLPMQQGVVSTITLDNYVLDNSIKKIDFLKIDVEGAEFDVIAGAMNCLQFRNIKFIQIEYGEHYKTSEQKFVGILDIVTHCGYAVYDYIDSKFVKVEKETFVEDYVARNYIISRDELGFTGDWNSEFKKNTANIPPIQLAIEIGVFEGRTTKYIAENMLLETGRVICVDPLEDQYLTENLDEDAAKMNADLEYFKGQYLRFQRNTANLPRPVNLIRKRFADAMPELIHLRAEFIYIDGDHRENAVYQDGVNAFSICRIGGFILFDDYGWSEGTKRGIDRFLTEYALCIVVVIKNYQVLIKKTYDL